MRQRIWALLLFAFVVAGVNVDLSLGGAPSRKGASPPHNKEFIDAFEKRLLAMFGLQSRPRPKRNVGVSDYMWDLYNKQSKHRVHKTETIRCYRPEEEDLEEEVPSSRYLFDVSGLQEHEEVRAAELVVPRESLLAAALFNATRPLLRVSVYDVLRPVTLMDSEPILRLLDSQQIRQDDVDQAPWLIFDVLPALRRWRLHPSRNHGLSIQLSTSCSTTSTSVDNLLLVSYSRDSNSEPHSRTKRSSVGSRKGHRRKGRKDSCRRHALFVDFSDVGWNDWIIAPPGYDAYFCHGDCPYPLADHHNTTNHAIVQTLVNSVNPTAVPRACCVPTELSSISMLYKDKYDNVVLKNYKDMVVEGCGCR